MCMACAFILIRHASYPGSLHIMSLEAGLASRTTAALPSRLKDTENIVSHLSASSAGLLLLQSQQLVKFVPWFSVSSLLCYLLSPQTILSVIKLFPLETFPSSWRPGGHGWMFPRGTLCLPLQTAVWLNPFEGLNRLWWRQQRRPVEVHFTWYRRRLNPSVFVVQRRRDRSLVCSTSVTRRRTDVFSSDETVAYL